ncbi:MAG: presqualene diphosphate synthase HpnD [Alphaproteobacteria bacterium]
MAEIARDTDNHDSLTYAVDVVTRSGTSFYLGMRILPLERRLAMYAIYAFCREVDDIADGPDSDAVKQSELREWRAEVGRLYAGNPTRPATRALADPVRRFGLPREEFLAIIDGMEMDLCGAMYAPDGTRLRLYCRRVAGAVGLLSLHAFGADEPEARIFALALGEALQLTNILRDVAEDAEQGRLYLPGDPLRRYGIDPMAGISSVLASPALDDACRDLAAIAHRRFADADRALLRCRRSRLRPALLMMGIYEELLDTLERRGWHGHERPLTLSKPRKLWAALRRGLFRPKWRPPA